MLNVSLSRPHSGTRILSLCSAVYLFYKHLYKAPTVFCSLCRCTLHDTQKSYCSCRSQCFLHEQREPIGTGSKSGPARTDVCGKNSYPWPSEPPEPTSNSPAVVNSRASVLDTQQHRDTFYDVWFHLRVSLHLLSC